MTKIIPVIKIRLTLIFSIIASYLFLDLTEYLAKNSNDNHYVLLGYEIYSYIFLGICIFSIAILIYSIFF